MQRPERARSAYGRVVTFSNLSVPLTRWVCVRGDGFPNDPTAPGHEGRCPWARFSASSTASQSQLDFNDLQRQWQARRWFSIGCTRLTLDRGGRDNNRGDAVEECVWTAENTGCSGFTSAASTRCLRSNLQVNAAAHNGRRRRAMLTKRLWHEIRRVLHGERLNGASSHVYCDGAAHPHYDRQRRDRGANQQPSLNRGVIINNQNLGDATRAVDPIGGYLQSRLSSPLSPSTMGGVEFASVTIRRSGQASVGRFLSPPAKDDIRRCFAWQPSPDEISAYATMVPSRKLSADVEQRPRCSPIVMISAPRCTVVTREEHDRTWVTGGEALRRIVGKRSTLSA